MSDASRYVGRPFVRFIELYVLWAIGKITPEDEAHLEAMTPKLQALYKIQGPWYDVIAGVLNVSDTMPGALRDMWKRNLEIAREHGTVLAPQDFAEMVVDENFSDDLSD